MIDFKDVVYFRKETIEDKKKLILYSFGDTDTIISDTIDFDGEEQERLLRNMPRIRKISKKENKIHIYYEDIDGINFPYTEKDEKHANWIKDCQDYIKKHTPKPKIDFKTMMKKHFDRVLPLLTVLALVSGVSEGVCRLFIGTGAYEYFLKPLPNRIKISQSNPFNNQTIKFNGENLTEITHEQAVDIIMSSIYQNSNLTNEVRGIFSYIRNYFIYNPYLNYKDMYHALGTLNNLIVSRTVMNTKSGNVDVAAFFEQEVNTSAIIEDCKNNKSTYFHEMVHSILPTYTTAKNAKCSKIIEGMTELITAECYDSAIHGYSYDKSKNYNAYLLEQKVVKVFFEMIGNDPILRTAGTKDFGYMISELSKLYGTEEEAKELLESISEECSKDDDTKEQRLAIQNNIVSKLLPYYEAMPEGNNKVIVYIYLQQLLNKTNISVIKSYFNKENNTICPPTLIVRSFKPSVDIQNKLFVDLETYSNDYNDIIYIQPIDENFDINRDIFGVDHDERIRENMPTDDIAIK